MEVPISCRLDPHEARVQVEEWRRLLNRTAGVTRPSSTRVVVRLTEGLEELSAVVGLAQREKACCPFFAFGIDIDADTVTLQVSVPDEAASCLDLFARVVP